MPLLPDDPRLTAYALGELDEAEREQIEAELSDWPEGQRAVADIRETAALLRHELVSELVPTPLEQPFARVIAATVGQAVDGASAACATVPVDGQPIASVSARHVNQEDWAGSPRVSRLATVDSPRRRIVALALAACLLVALGGIVVISASGVRPELAAAYWQTDDVDYAKQGPEYGIGKSAQSAGSEWENSGGPGYIEPHRNRMYLELTAKHDVRANVATVDGSGSTKDGNVKYTVTKPVWETKGKTKEIGYTIAKPVYASKTKTIEYTVNGKTMRKEVPYAVPKGGEGGQDRAPRSASEASAKSTDFKSLVDLITSTTSPTIIDGNANGAADNLKIIVSQSQTVHDDRPIAYPEAETWNQLLDSRKKLEIRAEAKALSAKLDELNRAFDEQIERAKSNPRAGERLREQIAALEQKLAEVQEAETDHHTEAYARIIENAFLTVQENPLSTFSIDVDTASYANVRRFLNQGTLPPPDAVRIEELLNYFTYDYEPPKDEKPFAVHSEAAACPWNGEHRLVRIGIKGKEIETDKRPASNLVFLIDVSGSMDQENKLPLLKSGLKLLVDKLSENDRVAIVVYAGASGLVLDSISGDHKESITASIEQLQPGGSTNGASGIELAYEQAVKHFIKGGANRVILCTDGDFNVGVTNEGDLTRLIEDKAKSGVFLSVLGFGEGNLKDATMEKLADTGNGNYAYIDTINEARKSLVEQMSGTLVTIAKDVKIQIEFNPAQVAAYRLIGYENRVLAKEDFNDDTKDAGEIGAGHTVTALYEIVPAGKPVETPKVDELKYQQLGKLSDAAASGDLLTLKLRYKAPEGSQSTPLEFPLKDSGAEFGKASGELKFAAAVAGFGMLLRQSQHKGSMTLDGVLEIAESSKGADKTGYRGEFIALVKKAKQIGGK